MAEPAPIVRMPLRGRYHECDPQGVVFNGDYLAYADMASFECLTALFGSHSALTLRFDIRRAGELVTEVVNRYVWVDTETLRPVSPPEDVREAFASRLSS